MGDNQMTLDEFQKSSAKLIPEERRGVSCFNWCPQGLNESAGKIDNLLLNSSFQGESLLAEDKVHQISEQLGFVGGNLKLLHDAVKSHLDSNQTVRLDDITARAKDFSARTRLADNDVILVIKASVDDTSSANGTARLEFEVKLPKLSLDQLDDILLKSGFLYQAKWSRERREFKYKGMHVCIDKNAGYGFLAEFEIQVEDQKHIQDAKDKLRSAMAELGVSELPQDRLERMFAFYNKNWREYYGTEKTFNVD